MVIASTPIPRDYIYLAASTARYKKPQISAPREESTFTEREREGEETPQRKPDKLFHSVAPNPCNSNSSLDFNSSHEFTHLVSQLFSRELDSAALRFGFVCAYVDAADRVDGDV
ncbi:hypothetical protein ACFX13_044974 [Malus domestica]